MRCYSSESGPNPPNGGSGGDGDRKPDQEDGYKKRPGSILNKEDQELVDWFAQNVKESTPKSGWHRVDDFIRDLEENGVPPEFREIAKRRKENGQAMGLLDSIRVAKGMSAQRMKMMQSRGIDNGPPMPTWMKKAYRKLEDSLKDLEDSEKGGQKNKGEDQKQQNAQDQQQQGQKQNQQKDGKGQKQPPPGFEFKFDTSTLILSSLISFYIYDSLFPGETRRDITWQEFRSKFFDKGLVEKLTVISGSKVRVELNKEAVSRVYADSQAAQPGFYYYFSIGSIESFDRRMDEAQNELGIPSAERIPVSYVDEVSWGGALLSLGPTLLMLGSLVWVSKRFAGGGANKSGIFGIGKSRAKRFNHETDIKTKFADVAGMDEAKVEIMEFVSFLKQPERFQKLGAKIPRGAILSGPPGTGKTLLAKATAGESGVPFFSVSGSEFVEMFVGVGPSRVRDLFANARKNTPCIIFIDEIDAIGKSRGKQNFGGGNDERESTLNQILTEMDGFNTADQVVVLAGTNRADVLDKALLRPGRFDRHIAIDRPTMDGRKQIFAVHLKKIVTNEDMEFLKGRLASLTPGFSGADIANCVNEAALVGKYHNALNISLG